MEGFSQSSRRIVYRAKIYRDFEVFETSLELSRFENRNFHRIVCTTNKLPFRFFHNSLEIPWLFGIPFERRSRFPTVSKIQFFLYETSVKFHRTKKSYRIDESSLPKQTFGASVNSIEISPAHDAPERNLTKYEHLSVERIFLFDSSLVRWLVSRVYGTVGFQGPRTVV